MAQFGRPISDIATGSWVTTPLWSDLDDNSDSDFVVSSTNPSSDQFECALTSSLTDPTDSTNHVVRYRFQWEHIGGGGPSDADLTVALVENTTVIATDTIDVRTVQGTELIWTTNSFTLTGGEADNISDYTDLRLRITANKTSGARDIEVSIAWAEFEVPDANTTTSKTQTGTARIEVTTTKTQTGVSAIEATTTKTQTGTARIETTATKTQTGVSRIEATATKTQTGAARVRDWYADDFTEGSDTAIESHTPTGVDAAHNASWTVQTAGLEVKGATDTVESDLSGAKRARLDTDLGSHDMIVEGVVDYVGGEFTVPGIAGRCSNTTGDEDTQKFALVWSQGSGNFEVSDPADNLTAWADTPSFPVTLRLEIIGHTAYGYVNGTLRITHQITPGQEEWGSTRAGIFIGQWSGVNNCSVDDFKAKESPTKNQVQTGGAWINERTTQTQTGTARIEASTTKTQTGTSRVEVTTQKTQTGTANISVSDVTTTKTQTGTSRVQVTTTKTQTGGAWIVAPFVSTPVTDNLNRTDADPIDSPWQNARVSAFGNKLKIVTNEASGNTTGFCGQYYGDAITDDQQAAVLISDATEFQACYISLRGSNFDTGSIDKYTLGLSSGGTLTIEYPPSQNIWNSGSGFFTPSTGDKLGFRVVGTELTVWADTGSGWRCLYRITDSNVTTGVQMGFEAQDSGTWGNLRFDDFYFEDYPPFVSTTKTQTGTAAIEATTTKTQTGSAYIVTAGDAVNVTHVSADSYNLDGGNHHVCVASDGTVYVVCHNSSDDSICVFKANDATTPTAFVEQDSGNKPTQSGRYKCPSARIENGIIHIIYLDDNGGSTAARHVQFNTTTDVFASDVSIASDGDASPDYPQTAIYIDENDDVHCAWSSKLSGFNEIYYANFTSGSWNTSVRVDTTASINIGFFDLTSTLGNQTRLFYIDVTNTTMKRAVGNAYPLPTSFSASSRSETDITNTAGQRVDYNDAPILTYIDATSPSINQGDGGTDSGISGKSPVSHHDHQSNEQWIYYEDANNDIARIRLEADGLAFKSGSSEVLETGTYNTPSPAEEPGKILEFVDDFDPPFIGLDDVTYDEFSQQITGNGESLVAIYCRAWQVGSPTGTMVARVYANSGTDPNSVPTGSFLAESEPLDISELHTGWSGAARFKFDGTLTLTNATDYHVAVFVDGAGVDASNYVRMGRESLAPENSATRIDGGSWTAHANSWSAFWIYTTPNTIRDLPHYAFVDETASPDILWQEIAVGDITTTKTQTGTAAIQDTTSKTQTGTARIETTATKTQTGISRVQDTQTKTQTGIARVREWYGDDFTESSDTELTSHTPTGIDAGSGWSYDAGSRTVLAASDKVESTSNGDGNRTRMTDDLGSHDMIVEADVERYSGTFTEPGILARMGSGAESSATKVEFNYDYDNSQWVIADGIDNTTFSDTAPTGVYTLKLEVIGETAKGYVGGVLKVTHIMDTGTNYGQQYAGFKLLQYSGANLSSVDNYRAKESPTKHQIQKGTSRIQTTAIKTQTGSARIQTTATKTQTGISRVQATTQQTQTGTARIGDVTTTKTQTGTARIETTATQTQTGTARIEITSTQTQTGTLRVEVTVTQTQTGIAAVEGTTTQTQTGVAAIERTTQKTQTGTANISVDITSTQTQTGTAAIEATTQQTQTGVAAVEGTTTKTQTGTANITSDITSTQTQTGTAAIEATTTQTQTGVAAIEVTATKTQTGVARIETTATQTQTGISRVETTATQTQDGTAAIQATTQQTQAGSASVQVSTTQTQTGAARIGTVVTQTQTGISRITASTTQTQTGVAAVQATSTQTQTGTAKIVVISPIGNYTGVTGGDTGTGGTTPVLNGGTTSVIINTGVTEG